MKKLLLVGLIIVSLGVSQSAWHSIWEEEKIRSKADSTEFINIVDFKKFFADSANIGKLVVEDTTFTDFIAPNDSSEVYVAGDLTVSGDVKPGVVSVNLWKNVWGFGSGTQNTLSNWQYFDGSGWASFDSVIADSVFILGRVVEDTNKVDSVNLRMVASRTPTAYFLVQDGTDWGASGAFCSHTYTNLNVTMPATGYYMFAFKPKAESAANKMEIMNVILYGHPQ